MTPFTGEWREFSSDLYLERRHRNWVLAEDLGDVVFISVRDVGLVHRERAEHIAAALRDRDEGVSRDQFRSRRVPSPVRIYRRSATTTIPPAEPLRREEVFGWFGVVAGVAVLVMALAVLLDDAGLGLAAALVLRGGRLILDS
jgi:hypothetical protein